MVYNVFSVPVVYKYKAHFWSEASLLHLFLLAVNLTLPLVFLYQTKDMWKKFDFYRESPSIEFKYQYLILLESANANPIICDSFDANNHCRDVQIQENDVNRDGRYDSLTIRITVVVPSSEQIHAVYVIFPIQFKITTVCWFEMESLILSSYNSFHAGSSIDMFGDLNLHQKTPLPCVDRDLTFNETLLTENSKDDFTKFIMNYSQRNVATRLINEKFIWTKTSHGEQNGFTLFHINIFVDYPEQEILYKTTFWQMIKWFLVQYLPVAAILFIICKRIRKFVFTNNVISTVQMIHSSKY